MMGFRQYRQRQRVVGLYVERNTLYALRDRDHPGYRTLTSDDERAAFLTPVPVGLQKAEVTLTGESGADADPASEEEEFTPVVPANAKNVPVYWISVYTWDGGEYRAWSLHPRAALRLHRQIQQLITSANTPGRDEPASATSPPTTAPIVAPQIGALA